MFAHFIRKMRTAPKYVSGSKNVSLAKCMAMTTLLGRTDAASGMQRTNAASKKKMLKADA